MRFTITEQRTVTVNGKATTTEDTKPEPLRAHTLMQAAGQLKNLVESDALNREVASICMTFGETNEVVLKLVPIEGEEGVEESFTLKPVPKQEKEQLTPEQIAARRKVASEARKNRISQGLQSIARPVQMKPQVMDTNGATTTKKK